tara:strand:- start:99 stop:1001 length:903 start_codon:yes stop_codon:yes gene_type:complete
VIRLPSGLDINSLIDDLKIFSWEACDVLLYYAQIIKDSQNKSKMIKNDNYEDPVTLADLKVNEIIKKRINENYENVNWQILSEEDVKVYPNNYTINKDFVWVLDPLDGTKDFIQGTGNYAMHLCLNYKNNPYLGIVLIPNKEELWINNNEMVWCENRYGTIKKLSLSKKFIFQDMKIVTSKNHRNKILKNLIEKLNFKEVIVMGSIGCKIASILRGESDIYICLSLPGESSPKDWDFAAPAVLLKAAGGAITNLNNQELTYGKSRFEQGGIIVASSNNIRHKDICAEIKNVIIKNELYPF